MLDISSVNLLAVLAATVIAFVLGGLWYGPLFGRAWMHAIGKTPEEIKPTPAPFVISFFTALITSLVVALLIGGLGIRGAVDGAVLGALVGFGCIATAMASDSAFCGWGLRLFLIQAGYRVSYSVIMGAILGAWQ